MNPHNDSESQIECCIPDKPRIFIGRDALVREIVSSLVEEEGFGIVNIVGGPGFGKSTVAVNVSHYLKNDHGIVVIFSYLRNASTVSELRLRLCHDFGINPEKDPKFSLMFWVKTVKKKVVLVMDNIEQLLESSDMKSDFTDLLLYLRKNSQQQLRILTTTRTEFSIFGQTKNYQVKVLDEVSSVQLLRECCPDEDMEDAFLSELAKLCSYVPLALCIAGTIIPDLADPLELIQWLREKPMQALRNSDQCVEQAIEFSFQKLSVEDQKRLICLSVFDGDFQRKSAEEVIEKNGLKTQTFLRNLANRSLVLASKDKRFLIHSLIRRFLADNDQFQDQRAKAQRLMVNHFLKMCHTLTIDCYTHNRFTTARKSLKKDIHNVEKTLKLCSQNQASNRSLIFELLANSEIYKSLSRFFYNISWDLLPESVFRIFFESCVKLAESRQQPTVGITFRCLVADQEGRKSVWKSPEYIGRMERIRAAFHKYETELRAERSLFEFCYYFLARYDSNISTNTQPPPDLQEADLDYKKLSIIEKASQAYMLMERGNLCKKRATKVPSKSDEYYEHMNCAKSFYDQAIDVLDDHELTCVLYKLLGDLFLNLHKNDDALKCYFRGIELREKLELDSNEAFVFLLKNCGACLYYLGRFEESVEMLKKSRDIADKLSDQDTVCKSRVYFVLAKAYRNWKPDCQEAAEYAKQAMEMRELLDSYIIEKLEKIILAAEENPETKVQVKSPTDSVLVARKWNTAVTRKAIPQFFAYPGNPVPKITPTPPAIRHNTISQSIPTRDIAYDVVTPTKTWESCSVAKISKKENQEKQSNKNLRISSREILKSIKHCEKFQILKNMDVGKLKKIGPPLQYFAPQKNLLLGRGSYGTSVYVGILQDGSEVAVKKVLLEAADENEVAVLRRIDTTKSPYILSYRDFLEDENFMYLILDLCEETLKEYVESHNILHLREEGPRMIKEILLGVKFLHDQEILHRDLKPSNILVDLKGQMKLADFGLSRVLNEDETTVKTFGKGTLGWMAAEVIEARNEERIGRYKKKSDIQSIGMIAFFILTGGRHPFGATVEERMTNISKGNPVDLDALDIYGYAKRFVTWLIIHDVDNRPYAYEALEHPFLQGIRGTLNS